MLGATSVREIVDNLRAAALTDLFHTYVPPDSVEEQWDLAALQRALESDWQVVLPLTEIAENNSSLTDHELLEQVLQAANNVYQMRVVLVGD